MDQVKISKLQTMKEAEGIVDVQRKAWDMSDVGCVPTFEIKAIASIGTVLVAKTSDDTVIGFIYAMPMILNSGRLGHYSHMMAVVPEYQASGIGWQMKLEHYKIARNSPHNIQKISWTVDPLLPNNAYLNFTKLGVISNHYYVNYYGDPSGDGVGIYAGVDTDRLLVDWNIQSSIVSERILDYRNFRVSENDLLKRSPVINSISDNLSNETSEMSRKSFSVQVPSNYQKIRTTNIELAKQWRLLFRKICMTALELGFAVVDYHSFLDEGHRKNYYEFSKDFETYD